MTDESLRKADWLVLGWVALTLITYVYNAVVAKSMPLAYINAFGLYTIGVLLATVDEDIKTVMMIGTVAGFVELGADWFLVEFVEVLVYPNYLAPLVSSPAYMPFAWALVISHFGYLAIRLRQEGLPKSLQIAAPAVLAMIGIGFYEAFAALSGQWHYVSSPGAIIMNAPLFIVVGEGIMFSTIHRLVTWDSRLKAGAVFGVVIAVSYVSSYYIIDGIALLL